MVISGSKKLAVAAVNWSTSRHMCLRQQSVVRLAAKPVTEICKCLQEPARGPGAVVLIVCVGAVTAT
jgi:hypothetical protein